MSESTTCIELPRVGCLLPALIVEKISLEKFAEKLSDHTTKDLIEMLYNRMSDDDLIEMAAEEDKPICGCCDEPTNPDGYGSTANVGCCEDCDIRVMCKDCGLWDEEDEVWRCPDCQEEHDENKEAHEEDGYCPICNKLTNTKNSCCSRTCCVCLEETFCEKCVKDCEDKDCSHDWDTHCICSKCEEDVNPPEPDGDGSGDE